MQGDKPCAVCVVAGPAERVPCYARWQTLFSLCCSWSSREGTLLCKVTNLVQFVLQLVQQRGYLAMQGDKPCSVCVAAGPAERVPCYARWQTLFSLCCSWSSRGVPCYARWQTLFSLCCSWSSREGTLLCKVTNLVQSVLQLVQQRGYLAMQGDKPCSVCVSAGEGGVGVPCHTRGLPRKCACCVFILTNNVPIWLPMQGDKPCSVRVSADAAEQPVQPHPGSVAAEALPGLPQLSLPSAPPARRRLPASFCAGTAVSALPLQAHRWQAGGMAGRYVMVMVCWGLPH